MEYNETIYHKHYTISWNYGAWCCNYFGNPIQSIQLRWSKTDENAVSVNYRTGERIWRTKSRRGVTDIFVGDTTLTVQRHDYAMELIDMDTGEVLKQKRPATDWGFTALNHKYLILRATARRYELIEAETLETKEAFSIKKFTNNHSDYVVNHIGLTKDGRIHVKGFHTVNDYSQIPVKSIATLTFEHFLEPEILTMDRGENV